MSVREVLHPWSVKGEITVPLWLKEIMFSEWRELNSLLWSMTRRYTAYAVEAGGGGDCQFHAVALGLSKSVSAPKNEKLDSLFMRRLVAMAISKMSKDDFDAVMAAYRAEEEVGSTDVSWRPSQVKDVQALKRAVLTPGTTFQGDDMTLSMLSRATGISFIVIQYPLPLHRKGVALAKAVGDPSEFDVCMCLLYTGSHYQLVVLRKRGDDRVHSLFNTHRVPDDKCDFPRLPSGILSLIKRPQDNK